MWRIWLIIAGFFFVLEIFTAGFLVFWLGLAGLLALIVSFITTNLAIQTAIFVVTSCILIFFTRPLITKLLKIDDKGLFPTNVYRMYHKEGIVLEDITPTTGKVKISGEYWSAISDSVIPKDSHIKVIEIDGVKLKVEKINDFSAK